MNIMNAHNSFALPQGRLVVGIISSEKMGLSFAHALHSVGHIVEFVYDDRAQPGPLTHRFLTESAGVHVVSLEKLVTLSELIILAVPDDILPDTILEIVTYAKPGTIIVHTSSRYGLDVFDPLIPKKVRALAIRPILYSLETFENSVYNFNHCYFIITANNIIDCAIAQSLVIEFKGTPIVVPDQQRNLCFTSIAEASNTIYATAHKAIEAFSSTIDAEQSGISYPQNLALTVLEPIFYQGIRCALDATAAQFLSYHQHENISEEKSPHDTM